MGVVKMSKKEEAVEQLKNCDDMHIWVKPIKDYIEELERALELAKKEHELLELYKQLSGIEQDIEYLCGLRDCMIEFSVEKPMEHIYSGIKEYKEKRDGLNYQIKQLEKELLDKEVEE